LVLETLLTSKRADAVQVNLVQEGQLIVRSTIWTRRPGAPAGLTHDVGGMPSYPLPSDVPVVPNEGHRKSGFPIFENFEERQVRLPGERPGEHIRVDMARDRELKPEWRAWYRFLPVARFDEPTLNCARSLILLDAHLLASCIIAHTKFCSAATTQTDMLFCGAPESQETDWLLADLHCPVSQGGRLWGQGAIWSESGRLLAIGQSTMMFIGEVVDR
jgi:acyl-CoA thioesterase